MTYANSYKDSSSPCVFRNRTAANSSSSYGHAARLNACGSHAATFSLEADVDYASADVKTRRLEAIDAVGKQRVERDSAAVESDRETEHRANAEERRGGRPRQRNTGNGIRRGCDARAPRLTAEELGDPPVGKGLGRRDHLRDRPRGARLVAVARHPGRGERGVVRPDRAVLVAHRVVVLGARAPRADAPAAREVGLAETACGRASMRGRCGAGPEHMPGVGDNVRHEVLPAVERLRIKGP